LSLEQHSISINIFGRKFPMKVSEEEALAVQEAARMINEQISSFKNIYRTQDDLNIALMCCLKIASDYVRQQHYQEETVQIASDKLDAAQGRLAKLLEES